MDLLILLLVRNHFPQIVLLALCTQISWIAHSSCYLCARAILGYVSESWRIGFVYQMQNIIFLTPFYINYDAWLSFRAQRLKMTAFTLPLIYDKASLMIIASIIIEFMHTRSSLCRSQTYLVIPKPGVTQTLGQQTAKVIQPFAIELWLLIIGFILAAAVLSVWFTDSVRNDRSAGRRMGLRGKTKRRKMAYVRLTLDSFLEKGLFFCSAGIEQDSSTSLPNKIMLFGFGLFILVTVSVRISPLCSLLLPARPQSISFSL